MSVKLYFAHGCMPMNTIKASSYSGSTTSETEAVNVMENTEASIRSWMSKKPSEDK